MRRALVIALFAVAGLAGPPSADAADPTRFRTPSGNIGCMTFESTLRCDMRRLGNARAEKPDSCEFDYGNAFGVTKTGRRGRILCVSDAVGFDHPVIAYGRTWRRNGFACRVRQSGLRCTNRRGHGFELRIGRQRLF
jgi:hypothetical protein